MKKIYSFSRLFTLLTLLFVGLGSAWATDIVLSCASTSLDLTSTTYNTNFSKAVGGVTFNSNNIAKNSNGVALKASAQFWNSTAFPGEIETVSFTALSFSSSSKATFTIYGGTSAKAETEELATITADGATDVDFSGKGYTYFIIKNGSSRALYFEATITYSDGGAGDTRTAVNITSFSATTPSLTIGGTTTTTTTVANDQNGWTPAYTYNSSNTNVATVDANGLVTAVADGTADITVSLNIANDDANWKKGATYSKTVTITVVDPNVQNLSTTFDFVNENYGLEQGDNMNGAYVTENTVVSSDLVNIKFAASSAARYGTYSSKAELRIYRSKDIKFSVPAGCKITKITLDSREDKYHYPAQNGTEPIIWTGKAEEVTIQFVANQVIQSITVDYQTPQPVQVAVSSAEYATYAPATDMVVTEEDAVFYASNVTYDAITFTALAVGTKVAAGEGLLVKGEGNHDFIPTTGATSLGENNKLHGVLISTDLSAVANAYVLAIQDNGVVAFCPVSGGSLAAGKAYLVRPAAPAGAPQAMRIVFETEDTQTATGIENIEAEQAVKFIENGQLIIIKNGVRYNALGQVVR